jgi:predicted nucleotidyltransferase
MPRRAATKARSVPTIEDLRSPILRITRKHGARNIRVFGSFARNEQRARSDVDLLVDLPKGATLLDQAGLIIELEESLHRRVDVLTYGGISRYLRDRILAESRPL